MYELKKSPSSNAERDIMTREYWTLLNLLSISFQINSYSSSGRRTSTFDNIHQLGSKYARICEYRMREGLAHYRGKRLLAGRWLFRIDIFWQCPMSEIATRRDSIFFAKVEHGRDGLCKM